MNVLLVAFEGEENSAKVILDKIVSNYDKLYLKNVREISILTKLCFGQVIPIDIGIF
jgi:hypothetical protein